MKKYNSQALTLIGLHVLLGIYSLSGFFSKNAAAQPFLSWKYIAFYCGMMAIMVIYAVGWQQVIKRLPLTLAFANKAVTVVWGILWGAVFFHESITPGKLIGAAVIVAGVVLFVKADGEENRHE